MLDTLGPSHIHYLNECSLRYIYWNRTGSGHRAIRTYNRNLFIGNLVHSVLNQMIQNQISLSEFDKTWEESLRSVVGSLANSPNIEEIKYSTPFYIIKKNQTKSILKSIDYLNRNYKSEFEFKGKHIHGSVDLLLIDDLKKTVRIIDYKTGPVWNYDNGKRNGAIEKYHTQIKSYGLYFFDLGYKAENIECEILGLSRLDRYKVKFTTDDYKKHSLELERLRDKLIKLLNQSPSTRIKLGSPSYNTCKFCQFKISCSAFLRSISHNSTDYINDLFLDSKNSSIRYHPQSIAIEDGDNNIRQIKNMPTPLIQLIKEVHERDKNILFIGLVSGENDSSQYWNSSSNFKEL